jgi:hypothetical protein
MTIFKTAAVAILGSQVPFYEMGNYRLISMKFSTQTKIDMSIPKITKAGVWANFQDIRRPIF